MASRAMRRAQQKRENKQTRRAAAFGLLAIGTGAPLGAAVIVAPAAEAAPLSVTNLNDAGAGSLRAAVAAANATPGADTISFGVTGVIQLTSGELEITEDVTVSGPGAGQLTVDAGGLSRIFNIHPATPADTDAVVISGLTLTDATAPSYYNSYYHATYFEDGGAIVAQGDYYSDGGSLTLDGVAITDSHAGNGGGVLVSSLDLTVVGSSLSNNVAESRGGAVRTFSGEVLITDTSLSGNSAGSGGALRSSGGAVSVHNSTLGSNIAVSGGGGGIQAVGTTLDVDNSVISGNAAGSGGGIALYGLYDRVAAISNSLISDNSALYGGGGMAVSPYATTGGVEVDNVTIVGNSATGDGGGVNFFGAGSGTFTSTTISGNSASAGGGISSSGTVGVVEVGPTMRNSIIANNTATTAAANDLAVGADESPIKLDYSLVETAPAAGSTSTVTPGSVIVGQDPQLGALADNGGPTQTMLPAATSPAVDKGKSFGMITDQRGSIRPVDLGSVTNTAGGDGADMGAVELHLALVNTGQPTIAGSAVVGSSLTETSAGSWTPAPTGLSRQWLRNGGAIPGATGTSYVLTSADAGTSISLRVTASASGYEPASANSPSIAVPAPVVVPGTLVTSGPGVIKGKLIVGRRLTAVPPVCTPAATVRYQWLRSGKPISNATMAKYKLKRADKGKKMSVRVTFTQPGYNTKVVTIKRTGRVKA